MSQHVFRLIMQAAAASSFLLFSACSTQDSVLRFFFDGVPEPGQQQALKPADHPPRRAPYKAPPPAVTFVEIPDLPPEIDWRARFDALPKNDEDVDWMRALEEKIITPRAGIAADAKDLKVVDDDMEYEPEGKPKYKVVFQHKTHTQWLGCRNCHTAIFQEDKGSAPMTMKNIKAGAYCGACHTKVALPEVSDCSGCHKGA